MPLLPASAEPIRLSDPIRSFDFEVVIPPYIPSLAVETAFFPNVSVEEIELPFRNSRTWVAGRANVEPGTMTCRDILQFKTAGNIWNWYLTVYNVLTGGIGLTSQYKKNGTILAYLSNGTPYSGWTIVGAWPTTCNFGVADYNANDVVKIETTIRYDGTIRVGT